MPDKKLNQEIMAMFASRRMDEQQSYLVRGRALVSQETEALLSAWLFELNAWADDKVQFDRQRMDDVEAELGLRGIDVPADQAPDAVEKLAAKSRALTEKWSPEERRRIEDRVEAQLAKLRPSKADKN